MFSTGLEDCFWILFLVNVIVFLVIKAATRHTFSQVFYGWLGVCATLIAVYCLAAAFNKFVLEDSSTAHWNAHARFTQAAIQERLKEEEMRVHVIAPPKMGGAKLNILYTVGDVPLARDNSNRSSGGRPSSGSLGLSGGGLASGGIGGFGSSSSGTPTTAIALGSTTSALIAPAALSSAVAGLAKGSSAAPASSSTPNTPPTLPSSATSASTLTAKNLPTIATVNSASLGKPSHPLKLSTGSGSGKAPPLEAIADASEPSSTSNSSSTSSSIGSSCSSSKPTAINSDRGGIVGGMKCTSASSVTPTGVSLLPETIDEEESDDRIESPLEEDEEDDDLQDALFAERKTLLTEEEKKQQ